MTTDSHLFKTSPSKGRLPLYEGKVIHQFEHRFGEPRYWLEEKVARSALLRVRIRELESLKEKHKLHVDVKPKQLCLDYQSYRIGFRDVAAGTNERTMIATVLPPNVFCPHTMSLEVVFHDEVRDGKLVLNVPALGQRQRLYLLAILNSFVADYQLRQKVTNHLSFFFVYQLPVPRLTMKDTAFGPIVERAARLICTTAQFDDLAKEVGLKSHKQGATEPTERAKLRAELDGLIAHLYDLTEEEFAYILTTFPLVPDPVKVSAHNAYRNAAKGLIK